MIVGSLFRGQARGRCPSSMVAALALFFQAAACTTNDRDDGLLVLRYSEINPPYGPQGMFAGELSRRVAEKSQDTIRIDVYYSASLVGYDIEPVQTGIVDFNQMVPSTIADLCPKMSVLDAPYVWENEAQIVRATDPRSPLMAELNECLEASNVRLLIVLPVGMRHLTTTKTPVYEPADLNGLKIRVAPSPVYQATLRAMGAIPTPMPFPELPTALVTGVVDGQENPFSTIVPHGLYRIQKHIVLTGHLPTNSSIFMNLSTWNRLDREQRRQLIDSAIEARDVTIRWVQEMDEQWKAEAREAGADIIGPGEALKLDAFIAATREAVRAQFEEDWGDLYDEILKANE